MRMFGLTLRAIGECRYNVAYASWRNRVAYIYNAADLVQVACQRSGALRDVMVARHERTKKREARDNAVALRGAHSSARGCMLDCSDLVDDEYLRRRFPNEVASFERTAAFARRKQVRRCVNADEVCAELRAAQRLRELWRLMRELHVTCIPEQQSLDDAICRLQQLREKEREVACEPWRSLASSLAVAEASLCQQDRRERLRAMLSKAGACEDPPNSRLIGAYMFDATTKERLCAAQVVAMRVYVDGAVSAEVRPDAYSTAALSRDVDEYALGVWLSTKRKWKPDADELLAKMIECAGRAPLSDESCEYDSWRRRRRRWDRF